MKEPVFSGTCTALVTPFLGGEVNYPMLEQLIRRQITAGIPAVVICGTTGESSSLSDKEKLAMFSHAKACAGTQCKIIAGTGSNDTEHTIALSQSAEAVGADALLVVSPYYCKPSQEGLYLHYRAVASAVHIPVIVYNVPSRTGTDLSVELCQKLARIENIAGIKEASGNLPKAVRIRAECPEDFSLYSGNDDITVPMMSLGARGVISVVSNLFPEKVAAMTGAALAGDFDTAASLQMAIEPLVRALFSAGNPMPVKAAMKLIGFDCGECRLPLSHPDPELLHNLAALL